MKFKAIHQLAILHPKTSIMKSSSLPVSFPRKTINFINTEQNEIGLNLLRTFTAFQVDGFETKARILVV